MTIYDIAKMTGVSIATVSRVLNGSDKVKPSTKKKIMDIIEKSGYSPNVFARGLGLDSMNTVGILCADCSDIYLAKAVYYIEKALKENGYSVLLACTGYDNEQRKLSLQMLLRQKVDCVILVGSSFVSSEENGNEYITEAAASVPIMLLNADFDYPNVFCTLCDDFKSTMDATNWLLNRNKKDILYLYNSHSYSGIRKLSGYRSALLMKDLPINKEYEQFFDGTHEDIDGVCDFILKLKSEGLSFNSILCSDDMLAAGAVKYAKKSGLSIPEDIFIIGYNNSILTKACEPELTSVDNHLELQCNQLVKSCVSVLNKNETAQKTIFSGEIVFRGTTSN